jgi:hypothetical protein
VLTPYDPYPAHRAPHPFSSIPSTDRSWDTEYYFRVFSPSDQILLATGLRISPDVEMIGGYALLSVAGHQKELRFNRRWCKGSSLKIGPYSVEIVEPLKKIRIKLDTNGSGMTFDLLWEGVSPPFLEEYHEPASRDRHTTGRGRYSQPGKAEGRIAIGDQCWKVNGDRWSGSRDRSWGLNHNRASQYTIPTSAPPSQISRPHRELRLRNVFRSGDFSGFWHLHEFPDGRRINVNDAPARPFGGKLFHGWADETIEFRSAIHEIELEEDTLTLKRANVVMIDTQDREWRQELEVAPLPSLPMTLGFIAGSWGDSGAPHPGSEGLAIEWYESSSLDRPAPHSPYCVGDDDANGDFGHGPERAKPVHGGEYLSQITMFAPDGSRHVGAGQIAFLITGPYRLDGLE